MLVANTKTRRLPCKLTPRERAEFAERNARAVDELRKLEEAKKDSAAHYSAQIKEKRTEVNDLTDCAVNGVEHREVTVYEQVDRAKGICETYRSDTGEVIETRHLTPAELQTTIDELL